MKTFAIPRFKGGSMSKVGGVYTPTTLSGKGVGKQVYQSDNVSTVEVEPARQMDMSRIARVLAETSVAKRGANRKVRL